MFAIYLRRSERLFRVGNQDLGMKQLGLVSPTNLDTEEALSLLGEWAWGHRCLQTTLCRR